MAITPEDLDPARSRGTGLRRWVPIISWWERSDGLSRRSDVVAGLTVAAMLVPQGMAYAALAGMPPVTGLYASIVPLVAYAVLGTSGQLAVGPVAIVSLLTASTLAPLAAGDPGRYVVLAGLLAVMVGVIQIVLGLLRAGRLTALLSHPVVSGFTSAAAIVIATSQIDKLLGVSIGSPDGWTGRIAALLASISGTHLPTLAVGAIAIALLLLGKRFGRRIPAPLIVVVLATAAVPLLGLGAVGVSVVGDIPRGLPGFQLTRPTMDVVLALLPGAVIISLLAYLEGLSIARAIAARTGDRIDADQELLATGAANLTAGALQAFPVAGGFSRSAVNHAAGARTPLAGVVAAGGVLLTLVVAAPMLSTLPEVVLAAVVLVAVIGLMDVRGAIRAWRIERTDGLALAITFFATLLIGVEIGIGIGILASLVLSHYRVGVPAIDVQVDGNRVVVHMVGPLLPASGVRLLDTIEAVLAHHAAVGVGTLIVLDLSGVPSADGSGVDVLVRIDEMCSAAGLELRLTGARPGVLAPLHRAEQAQRFRGRIDPATEVGFGHIWASTAQDAPGDPAATAPSDDIPVPRG